MRAARRWWRTRGLRFQLAATIAAAGLLVIVLNAILLGIFLDEYVIDRQGTVLGQQAAALAHCSPGSPILRALTRGGTITRLSDTAVLPNSGRRVIVVDAAGKVRYASRMPATLRAILLAHLRADLAHGAYTGGTPAWHKVSGQIVVDLPIACSAGQRQSAGSRAHGPALLLAEDQSVAARAWRRVLNLLEIVGAGATAVAVLVGAIVGPTITRPIAAVTRTARAIAAGDYDRRVRSRGPAEIDELANAFNGMVEEVMTQRRVERDLLANISHDLASPLGLIRGYAEALADGVIPDGPQRLAALHAIQAESGRLERLTADLLDLALLDTGQVSMRLEAIPAGELLRGLHQRFVPRAQGDGIMLTVEAAPDLPPVRADGLRLEQVLVNLVNNALAHTPAGGTVRLAAAADGQEIEISVADTGSGISPEDLPRIWERFYRADKGRDRREGEAGVGLGLAISRSIVTRMGGTITVESAPNQGTTFRIRLPAAGKL
jgi:signal transduction histidine kinase